MILPDELADAIEVQVTRSGTREVARASAELTEWYRAGRPAHTGFRFGQLHRIAYAAARMPATLAAAIAVLRELRQRMPDVKLSSQLDLCAGPGTLGWAAAEMLEEIETRTFLERDPGFIELGRELASHSPSAGLRHASWQETELPRSTDFAPHDLVTLSYGLNELAVSGRERLVQAAWQATRQALVLIEPGTPAGYEAILLARTQLLDEGACIAAPCPHHNRCPLLEGPGWCHFVRRLPRTRLHRITKGAELGYEDEKYSYLIVSRTPALPYPARVLAPPREFKATVQLELCTAEGLRRESLPRRNKDLWRRARKAEWGDVWD